MTLNVKRMSIWLPHSLSPADRAWSLVIMSAQCRSNCCVLQVVRDLSLHVRRLSTWLLRSCRFYSLSVITFLMSPECRSDCSSPPPFLPPAGSTWSLLIPSQSWCQPDCCILPSCRKYVMLFDVCTMSTWLLHSPPLPSCRVYVISFDVCGMSIWLLGSPTSCRAYVISFDVCGMLIWPLYEVCCPVSLKRCIHHFVNIQHPHADRTWFLLMA